MPKNPPQTFLLFFLLQILSRDRSVADQVKSVNYELGVKKYGETKTYKLNLGHKHQVGLLQLTLSYMRVLKGGGRRKNKNYFFGLKRQLGWS